MPETARILQFPSRRVGTSPLTREEARKAANSYLNLGPEARVEKSRSTYLDDADILLAICGLLWERSNTCPADAASEASFLYGWVVEHFSLVGLFDEQEFFAGEFGLLAGVSFRLLGRREETERWLDRAEASFRHTVSPAAHLARVSYARLTLKYDMRRHEDVLELLPSTARTFEKLGMDAELSKCRFLEAMSLKELGRIGEAAERLHAIGSAAQADPAIQGMALVNLGDLRSSEGRFDVALGLYRDALPFLKTARRLVALADLKAALGETLRRMGQYASALEAYRESARDYLTLGMAARTAYLQVVVAETLLETGRTAEAELEIRAALPTIEREKMVPEGFAAIAILNESVRQRKANPKALGELRQYLQSKN